MKSDKPGKPQKPTAKAKTAKTSEKTAAPTAKAIPAKAAAAPAKAAKPAPVAPKAAPAPAPKATSKPASKPPAAVAKKRDSGSSARTRAGVGENTPASPAKVKIPPILLEGDAPAPPSVSGPGKRYATGPAPSAPEAAALAGGELPESYGTKILYLTARDPRWLFASWDYSLEEIRGLNAKSDSGALTLRVFQGGFDQPPLDEIGVHPESRNWFIPVPRGAASYVAELGYRDARRQWVSLSRSAATLTPPDTLSDDLGVRFATIPYDIPFAQLVASVKSAVREHLPLVEALAQLRSQGHKNLPADGQMEGKWSAAQDRALAEVISLDTTQRIWIGSLEITELIRRRLAREISSMGAAQFGVPSSWSGALGLSSQMGSVTSPFGAGQKRRGFWFNVNAELIIYGATEPDATVTIGDRKIRLRPDGTFSFRFALPDGDYRLPAAAHSADGEETRSADLKFHRGTAYEGDVGKHPQDPALRPPVVAAVS
jgi:hypothetical protein